MTQEIISTHFQHGFVFNMITIHFNNDICEEMLKNELIDDNKRELLHTSYLYYFNQSASLKSKTNYGDSDIKFSQSIDNINYYIDLVNAKIKNKINKKDFDKYILIIEEVLELSEEQQKISTNIVVPYIKQIIEVAE